MRQTRTPIRRALALALTIAVTAATPTLAQPSARSTSAAAAAFEVRYGDWTDAGRGGRIDPPQMEIVKAETIRFWRTYLVGDKVAAQAGCDLPTRIAGAGEAFVKATRCGPPTPIMPVAGQ